VRHPHGGISDFLTEQEARAFVGKNPEYSLEAPQRTTHNYVVFDDKLIDILQKYGIGGLIAGGGWQFSATPVDYDPFAPESGL
jgi:hypothetical protein